MFYKIFHIGLAVISLISPLAFSIDFDFNNDVYWHEGFSSKGANSYVSNLITHNNSLYMFGEYTFIDEQRINKFAEWDGYIWGEVPINGSISSMITHNGDLYALGYISIGGNKSQVACWDGQSWHHVYGTSYNPLDGGIIAALGDSLVFLSYGIVGGVGPYIFYYAGPIIITDSEIIHLDSTLDGIYTMLEFFNNQIVIAGIEIIINENDTTQLAVWDGNEWIPMIFEIDGDIQGLYATPELLFVYGEFSNINGIPVNNIAAWNGSDWSDYGSGLAAEISQMNEFNGQLVAVQQSGWLSEIYVMQNSTWINIGTLTGWIYGLCQFNDLLVIGGDFGSVNDLPASNIAFWDGDSWSAVDGGNGLSETVYNMNYDGNHVTAYGYYLSVAGDAFVDQFAIWDGNNWSATPDSQCYFDIYMGSPVRKTGGSHSGEGLWTERVEIWNGTEWHELGENPGMRVTKIHVHNDNLIWYGMYHQEPWPGYFHHAYIWNGSEWEPFIDLGSGGVSPSSSCYINTMYSDDTLLYIGGYFLQINGIDAQNFGAWDGSNWSSYQNIGQVSIITSFQEDLIVMPGYYSQGEHIYRLNKATLQWELVANPAGHIHCAEEYNDLFVVGGDFIEIDGVSCGNIAAWDGTDWYSLRSGTNGTVYSIATDNDKLFVGGNFGIAGNKASSNFAVWSKWFDYLCGDVNSDYYVNILDVIYLIKFLYHENTPPDPYHSGDINGNCVVNILDITALIQYLYQDGQQPVCECPDF